MSYILRSLRSVTSNPVFCFNVTSPTACSVNSSAKIVIAHFVSRV